MAEAINTAFERRVISLPLSSIMPRKKLPRGFRKTARYKRIAKSIAEVGIVEPLVVALVQGHQGRYFLLDGHYRLAALSDSGADKVRCLVARDDEAFTYNKRVNRLATVQEHFMIVRAVERGASEEKLARALNLDVAMIKRRRTLLDRICPEAVELLKDKSVNFNTFDVLRRMKPMRQIEVAELMAAAANWTLTYAKALLAATRQEDLAEPDRPKKVAGMTPERMARMEREMESLQKDFKQIENSYGDDILHLVIASGYLAKLVSNSEIEKFLTEHYPEFLQEFRAIIAASSLDQQQEIAA